jgi:hypothetical protein
LFLIIFRRGHASTSGEIGSCIFFVLWIKMSSTMYVDQCKCIVKLLSLNTWTKCHLIKERHLKPIIIYNFYKIIFLSQISRGLAEAESRGMTVLNFFTTVM